MPVLNRVTFWNGDLPLAAAIGKSGLGKTILWYIANRRRRLLGLSTHGI